MSKRIKSPTPLWSAALCALVLLAAAAPGAPVRGQAPPTQNPPQTDVAVALVLAVDSSGSVSNARFELQKRGYAAAFRNPQVLGSIRSLATQSIAVTMMQWTGPRLHMQVVEWMPVKDEATAAAFAAAIETAPPPIVQRRHFDQRRHRLLTAAAGAESVQRHASHYRYFRRRRQQQRPPGEPGARRGGA